MWTKPLAGAGMFHPVEPDAASAPTIGMHGVDVPRPNNFRRHRQDQSPARGGLLDSHVAGRSVQREDEVGGKQVAFVVGSTKTLANGVAVYTTYCARVQISAFPRRPCRTPLVRLGPAGPVLGQTTGRRGRVQNRRAGGRANR